MKAILLMELPDDINLDETVVMYQVRKGDMFGENITESVKTVSLRPMPKRNPFSEEEIAKDTDYESRKFSGAFNLGWNNCLEEIEGQDEDTI